MAEKRMFSNQIVDSDAFLSMPLSSQALYFHLNMKGDDEGFVNNPIRIARAIGSNDDDLKLLILKNFVLSFESGIIVIKHWKLHNWIRNDRVKPTAYIDEKNMLEEKENKVYSFKKMDLSSTENMLCQTNVSQLSDNCQHSIEEISIDKFSTKDICADSEEEEVQKSATVFDKESAFATFWEKYPKKLNKAKARVAFFKECKSEEMLQIMLEALEQQKNQVDWKKDNGQFIPHPTTWLNGRRWEDEITRASNEQPRYSNTDIKRVG